jgi:hypothetical protein
MADVLSLLVDTVEPRISQDRILVLRTGENWDRNTFSSIFLEPETQTAMLMPLCGTPTWQTSAAGLYHRLRKEDCSFTTASKWANHDLKFDGDTYLHCNDPANEVVQSLESYDKNQAMFVSLFGFSDGNSNRKLLECGWGTYSGTASARDLSLRIWSNGNVEVWRGATRLSDMKLVTRDKNKQTPANNTDQGAPTSQVANDRVDICMIPYKRRDLLLITNFGSDTLTFDDLDEHTSTNTIARAGTFWFVVPSGTAQVQFAPLRYVTAGSMLSSSYQFRQAPADDATASFRSFYDAPAGASVVASLVETDGTTPFVADGTKDTVKMKIALAGDGKVTPFYYGSVATFEPLTANTVNDSTDITAYALSASLSVGESPADTKFNLLLKSPEALVTAGMTKSDIVSNRPFEAKIGTIKIFSGRTNTPKKNIRISDEATQLTLECQDRWKALEKYVIRSAHPLDGMELVDAIKYLAGMPGYTAADMDIEALDFTIESEGNVCKGDWTAMMEAGDTPAKWLLQLQESYFADSVMGWVPTATGPKFTVKMIDTLNAAAYVKTLYPARANALLGGFTADNAHTVLIRSFNKERFEIEANEVAVTWFDPKTLKYDYVQDFDRDSQDPTTAVDDRPDNWVGEPRIYARGDSRLVNNPAKAAWCAKRWMKLLSNQQQMAEWDCEFLLKTDGSPVWKGDLVYIFGETITEGLKTYLGLFRITSLKADFKLEDSGRIWRPTHYTAVLVKGSEIE